MPYQRRNNYKKTYSRRPKTYSRKSYVPKVPFQGRIDLRKQQAGVDTKTMNIKFLTEDAFVFQAIEGATPNYNSTTSATMYHSPLQDFIGSTQYTDYIKKVYNEFRIIKATYKFIFINGNLTTTVGAAEKSMPCVATYETGGQTLSLLWTQGWLRSASYGVNPTYAAANAQQIISQFTKAVIKPVNSIDQFIATSSIIATGSEKEWLQTNIAPNSNPNWEFFNPLLCTNINLPLPATPASSTATFKTVVDIVVELRGTKMNASY